MSEDPSSPWSRQHQETRQDSRTPAQVDRDRLIYSAELARLAEVTQVVSADHGRSFHNRLTHSLKVAQLARRIAEQLNKEQPPTASVEAIDPDVCEAAGLAHDLGHAPFGHIGEETLDEVLRERDPGCGGYEGNPQSFRIATRLGTSDADPGRVDGDVGFNFTRRTLNALFKYPWLEGGGPDPTKLPAKCGAYRCDAGGFNWARQGATSSGRSIEAEIMDWADDITFAVHDLMDFYQAGRIPLEAINSSGGGSKELSAFLDATFRRKPEFASERARYEGALKRILEYISFEQRYEGTRSHREAMWKNSTLLISRFLEQMELSVTGGARRLQIATERKDEVKMLKEFTWHYVILHHDLAMQQHGQKHMLSTVMRDLLDRTEKEEHWPVFPPLIRDRLVVAKQRGESTARTVVDYVASMSDLEVSTTYRNMRGRR